MLPSCVPTIAVLLLALATASATAQTDDEPAPPRWSPAEIEARLDSTEPADVAWAGFLVQRDSLRAAVPAVRRALARLGAEGPDAVASEENRFARLQLLDALLRLDVRVPGEDLLPHVQEWLRAPALVLAARSGAQNLDYFAARMAALRRDTDLEWRICGNLLAAWRAPGFAAQCLQELEFEIAVTVRDDGPRPQRGVG